MGAKIGCKKKNHHNPVIHNPTMERKTYMLIPIKEGNLSEVIAALQTIYLEYGDKWVEVPTKEDEIKTELVSDIRMLSDKNGYLVAVVLE